MAFAKSGFVIEIVRLNNSSLDQQEGINPIVHKLLMSFKLQSVGFVTSTKTTGQGP